MLDITGPEFLALAVIALLVFGPDKLPQFASDAARFLRHVRRLAADARGEVRESLGPEFSSLADIDVRNLNPRAFVSKHVFDGDDDFGLGDAAAGPPAQRRNGSATAGPAPAPPPTVALGEVPPYDADAT